MTHCSGYERRQAVSSGSEAGHNRLHLDGLVVPILAQEVSRVVRVPLSSETLVVLEQADGLSVRVEVWSSTAFGGRWVRAAVFGRLPNDLKIDCSPHGFRSSFRVVAFDPRKRRQADIK